MKNYRLILLTALGLASASASYGQDLILGFNDAAGPSAAQNDYVVDLGLTGATLVADAAANNGTYTLNSAFNLASYYSADANALNDLAGGVLGASASGVYPRSLYLTASAKPNVPSSAQFANAANENPSIGEYASTTAGGWSQEVAAAPGVSSPNTVSSYIVNPLGYLSSGVLSLQLFAENQTKSGLTLTEGAWVDEGTLTINANNDSVIFTSAVPEPSTYGLLAGAGLLVVSLRRQFGVKNA